MSLEKYESKQVQICRPASMIYGVMSSFSNFTPILQDKVENWHADEDTCSFKVKGFNVGLRMAEKEPFKLIKITGDETSPMPFTFWIQLQEIAENDTRMRMVLHAEMNMMIKMMVGGKLQDGIDQIAEKIAETFNNAPM